MTSLSNSIMDSQTARRLTEQIKDTTNHIRSLLLSIYVSNGWASLGYNSWHEYLTSEFDTNHTYLRRQTHAALLEAELSDNNELVGLHKESHLRAILETLPNGDEYIGLRALAFYITHDRHESPQTKDFIKSAREVYVLQFGDERIKDRFANGELSANSAYEITKYMERGGSSEMLDVMKNISDPNMIPVLIRLEKNGSDTWEEISASKTVPGFPDPIPLAKATESNLMAWLDMASAEHIAISREQRRPYWDERNKIVDDLLNCIRESRTFGMTWDKQKELFSLIERLDMHEKGEQYEQRTG